MCGTGRTCRGNGNQGVQTTQWLTEMRHREWDGTYKIRSANLYCQSLGLDCARLARTRTMTALTVSQITHCGAITAVFLPPSGFRATFFSSFSSGPSTGLFASLEVVQSFWSREIVPVVSHGYCDGALFKTPKDQFLRDFGNVSKFTNAMGGRAVGTSRDATHGERGGRL